MASAVYTAISTVPGAGRRRKRMNAVAPPPGYYDPAIDAGVGQANRGLFDLGQDTLRDATRMSDDYLTGANRIGLNYGNDTADLGRSFERGTQDIGLQRADLEQQSGYGAEDDARARQRLEQDHSRALEALSRQYAIRGSEQRQAGQSSGVAAGGFFNAARGARATNMSLDKQPIDLAYSRNVEDLNTGAQRRSTALGTALGRLGISGARLGEDFATGGERALQGRDLGLADLTLGNQRGTEDLATRLARGIRENSFYGQDSLRSAFAQATANGWRPPRRRRR